MDITIRGISPKLAKLMCTVLKVNKIDPRSDGLVDLNATITKTELLNVRPNVIVIHTEKKDVVFSRLDFVEVQIL